MLKLAVRPLIPASHAAAGLARRLRTAAWLCLALLCSPGTATAHPAEEPAKQAAVQADKLGLTAAERAWLREHPRLRVYTKTEWSPIDVYSYEGQFRGLSGDYLALIGQRLGIRFEFTASSTLAESLEALKDGRADLLPSVARTPQREAFMAFSSPYLDVPNVYVARRGVAAVGPDQTMAGLRVAAERGYAVIQLLHERHPQAAIVEFPDSAAALRGVSEGRADVYLGALPTTSHLVEKLLLTNLEIRSPWHSSLSALHLGVRKDQTVLLGILDKALASVTLAERQSIHRRWVPLHSLLAEPSPPLKLSEREHAFLSSLPALRVGYDVAHHPYTLRDANGEAAGMAFDYLKLMADKLGLPLARPYGSAWPEIYGKARRGEVDLLIAVSANAERGREFLFIGPWISTPNVLITRRDEPAVLSLEQFFARKVAVLRDGQTKYLLSQLHPGMQLVEVDTRDALLAAVANGQADGAFVNATYAAPQLAQGLSAALKMAAFFPELNSDLYFAVRRDQPELAALLTRALDSLNDAERAEVLSRWSPLPLPADVGGEARELVRRAVPFVIAIAAALLVSLVWALHLRREVARRRVTEHELARSRDEAHRLANQRAEFIAVASHEIRAPANAVLSALGQLARQPLSPAVAELARLAQRSAQTLSEFINNLLDLSKSDAGALRLVAQPDSLQITLQSAVEAMQASAEAKGLKLTLTLDERLAGHHLFDGFRLRQIALNLMSNAIRYTAAGQVAVQAEVTGETRGDDSSPRVQDLHLIFSDSGIGIPADKQPLLFQPYVQGGDTQSHREGGTGLGLALCKRLIDAMGGQVTLKSAPGQGTTVTVALRLPVVEQVGPPQAAPLQAAQAAAAPARQPVAELQPEPPPAPPGPLRVLVADDDRVQQLLMSYLLERLDCVVDVAHDGDDAARLWQQHGHPLVFTDLHMPGQDGLALARWLRAQAAGNMVWLVGTSADLDPIDAALSAGMDKLLQKPVPEAVLAELVEQLRQARGLSR